MQVQVLYQNMECFAWASCRTMGIYAVSWFRTVRSTDYLRNLACCTSDPALSQKDALSPLSWL